MSLGNCPHCGWADSQPYETLSRHHTSDGMTVWTRCWCGSLQIRGVDAAGVRILVRGRPEDGVLDGTPAAPVAPAVPRAAGSAVRRSP